jgi:pimeloyl-ACP methyl ester carboxylesterase
MPVPIQLIYAKTDPMVSPSTGKALGDLLPDVELRWLAGASHFAHVDAPAAFLSTALPFLLAR